MHLQQFDVILGSGESEVDIFVKIFKRCGKQIQHGLQESSVIHWSLDIAGLHLFPDAQHLDTSISCFS